MGTKSFLRAVTFAVAAAILISMDSVPAQAGAPEEAFLIVEGAKSVREVRQGGLRAINYVVDLAYPDLAVGEAQWEQLRATGWSKCVSTNPHVREAELGWLPAVDAERRHTQWHIEYWLKGNQMIAISLEYDSADQKNGGEPAPDNTTQHVTIAFGSGDMTDTMKTLKVDCSG